VAKIAKTSPQLEIKSVGGWLGRITETIRNNEKDVEQSRWQRLEQVTESINDFFFVR